MITSKIFKVKETVQHDGKKYYRVVGFSNRLEYFLGVTDFNGQLKNKTFMEALNQIDTLIDNCVISDKTIHVVFSKKEKKQKIKKNQKNLQNEKTNP